jgi:DNA-binding NarL/FixJ family response regulator
MINVIVVDDQELIVQGLSMIIQGEKNLNLVGTAHNGMEAIAICEKEQVDIVLMDIRMPEMDGVEATLKIKERESKIKVIILTTFKDDEFIFGTLKNGASGYLLKDATPEEIVDAIQKVYSGGTLINPQIATKVVDKLTEKEENVDYIVDRRVELLTNREKDICHYLGHGKNNKEISEMIYISEGTVKNNITRILDKLELRDRTQLALYAVKNKL